MAGNERDELVALIRREAHGAEGIADAILHPLNRGLVLRALGATSVRHPDFNGDLRDGWWLPKEPS